MSVVWISCYFFLKMFVKNSGCILNIVSEVGIKLFLIMIFYFMIKMVLISFLRGMVEMMKGMNVIVNLVFLGFIWIEGVVFYMEGVVKVVG